MSTDNVLGFLRCALCLGLALTAVSCSKDADRAACQRDIEDINYIAAWQDRAGWCSGLIMFESQCEPGEPFYIRLGFTEDGALAPYEQSDARDLWYKKTNSTLAQLPPDVIRTGLFSRERELFIAADRESAYVRTQQGVEIWQIHKAIACSSPDPNP